MRKTIFITILVLTGFAVNAQDDTTQVTKTKFTLGEAVKFALENNREIKKAELEIVKAKKKVWETTAIGLPQVSGKFSYSYMLTVPDALEQFSSLGDMFGPLYENIGTNRGYLQAVSAVVNQNLPQEQQINVPDMQYPQTESQSASTDDLRTTATLDLTVSQLIFNGSYIVGLQASKTYQKLSKYMAQQKENDIRETVAMAYTGVVIAKENITVLQEILKTTKQNITELEAMHKEGFVENTDVDQLRLTASTIENNLKNIELQVTVAKQMLKLSMGMDMKENIEISDDLDGVLETQGALVSKELDFEITQNISYLLLDTQEKLTELDLKNSKANFLPTVAGFYQHQENFNDKSFNLTPPDVVGVSVDIPIFSSWQRMSVVQQKQIELEQTRLNKETAVEGLRIQFTNALNSLLTARNNYNTSKANMKLSKRIFEKTQVKYKEGVSTSFDLSQAQGQYLQSQTSYYQSAMALIEAKTKIDKLRETAQPVQD